MVESSTYSNSTPDRPPPDKTGDGLQHIASPSLAQARDAEPHNGSPVRMVESSTYSNSMPHRPPPDETGDGLQHIGSLIDSGSPGAPPSLAQARDAADANSDIGDAQPFDTASALDAAVMMLQDGISIADVDDLEHEDETSAHGLSVDLNRKDARLLLNQKVWNPRVMTRVWITALDMWSHHRRKRF